MCGGQREAFLTLIELLFLELGLPRNFKCLKGKLKKKLMKFGVEKIFSKDIIKGHMMCPLACETISRVNVITKCNPRSIP